MRKNKNSFKSWVKTLDIVWKTFSIFTKWSFDINSIFHGGSTNTSFRVSPFQLCSPSRNAIFTFFILRWHCCLFINYYIYASELSFQFSISFLDGELFVLKYSFLIIIFFCIIFSIVVGALNCMMTLLTPSLLYILVLLLLLNI